MNLISGRDVDGLTALLEGASASVRAHLDGRELPVRQATLEGRSQPNVTLSMQAHQEASLVLVEAA